MAKAKEPVITVSTVFAGHQTDRQAFIDLIRQRNRDARLRSGLDAAPPSRYTETTPRSGIHSGMENKHDC